MSKYLPLSDYLSEQRRNGQQKVEITFDYLAELLGKDALPESSKYPAWWSESSGHQQYIVGWKDSGYKLKVNLKEKKVLFYTSQIMDEVSKTLDSKVMARDNFLISSKAHLKEYYPEAPSFSSRSFNIKGYKKIFDFVAEESIGEEESQIWVGHGKYSDKNSSAHSALQGITELVWLLQALINDNRNDTLNCFIIFGGERAELTAKKWLDKYGRMADNVDFLVYTKEGQALKCISK